MSEQPTPAFEVRHLRIETDGTTGPAGIPLVRDVTFRVYPGEMVGLAGESGSGKSLTASAIASLLPVGVRRAGGVVEVAGKAVPADAGVSGHEIAMIFQNPMTSLNPSMRIGAQIAEAIRLRDPSIGKADAKQRAVEILERVDITDAASRAKQYPFEFSGGMRQRVMIGIAIALEPSILIADEPTTALDVTVQKGVMDLIDRLRAELDLAVLLISHDLAVVSQRCDRLLMMYAGELIETGPTVEVLSRPLHPYVDGLIRCIPESAMEAGSLQPLPGQVLPASTETAGCRFFDRCDQPEPRCADAPVELVDATPTRAVRCVRWPERVVQTGAVQVVAK